MLKKAIVVVFLVAAAATGAAGCEKNNCKMCASARGRVSDMEPAPIPAPEPTECELTPTENLKGWLKRCKKVCDKDYKKCMDKADEFYQQFRADKVAKVGPSQYSKKLDKYINLYLTPNTKECGRIHKNCIARCNRLYNFCMNKP